MNIERVIIFCYPMLKDPVVKELESQLAFLITLSHLLHSLLNNLNPLLIYYFC